MTTTPPSGPSVETISVQDLALRLWVHRRQAGQLSAGARVLCLHGTLDTGRSFDAVAAALLAAEEAVAEVLALDLRGHGDSDFVGPGGSYHLLDFAKDVSLVLQALAVAGRAVDLVIGHSMGGNIALMVGGAQPALMPRLLVVDAMGGLGEDGADQPERLAGLFDSLQQPKRPFRSASSLAEAVARTRGFNPGLSEQGAIRMLAPALRKAGDGTLSFPFDPKLRGPTPYRFPESTWQALSRRRQQAGALTHILCGTDGFVPAGTDDGKPLGPPFDERAQALGAEVVRIEGGHHLHVDAVDAVVAQARALLLVPARPG